MTTFNYSSKSSIKDNLTEILIGAALIIKENNNQIG